MAGNLYEQGYYETGTASVTQGQTVVTGQGTAWLQIVRPADDFGKHVGMPIPIASVDSDTQITLAYPWPGPTQAAAPYRVTFTPYHVAYRQALQEIGQLLSSGNVSALAELVGEAGKFPVFTGAGAMDLANLSDYAGNGDVKGPANSTASHVALFDGATGKALKDGFPVSTFMRTVLDDADAATARGTLGANNADNLTAGTVPNARVSQTLTPDKAFRRGNILGNVSQSGGIPTGAIIERGSNANGEYVRYADGTQICWHAHQSTSAVSSGRGALFRSAFSETWTYPATFFGAPRVMGSINDGSGNSGSVFGLKIASPNSSFALFEYWASESLLADTRTAGLMATGRWY